MFTMFENAFLFKYYIISFLLVSVVSYLIGCINSSIVVTRLFKSQNDIRSVGSGNAGFTNVLRTMGKKMAIITFLGDFAKGVAAVALSSWITSWFFSKSDSAEIFVYTSYIATLMCVIGHIYPCFFGFKGGKAILTTWSSMLLIDWRVFLTLITVFIVVLAFSKIVSLASIIAAISYPISTFIFSYSTYHSVDNASLSVILFPTLISFIVSVIIVIKHRGNISRLLNGTEKKISVHK